MSFKISLPTEPQRRKTRTWSSQEDQRLIQAVGKFGIDNWSHVANYVGNGRTRAQCAQRWNRGLDPRISRDQWTPEEENKLMELVECQQIKGWTHIANEMGNRSDVQCRYHYLQMKKEGKVPFSQQKPDSLPMQFDSGPHSLDLNMKFSFSPEPFIPKIPVVSLPPASFKHLPKTNSNPLEQFSNPMDNMSPGQVKVPTHIQFNIPPPTYNSSDVTDADIPDVEPSPSSESNPDFTIKLPELDSSIYMLW